MSKRLIYADDAIKELSDALAIVVKDNEKSAKFIIDRVPSAEPEIIRCKDCVLMLEDKIFHRCWCNGREVKPDHFCGYAERRQDE